MKLVAAALILLAVFAGAVAGCGGSEEEPAAPTGATGTTDVAESSLEPAEVEASVTEQLADDEYAGSRSPEVDCGEEPAPELECSVTGEKGLAGTAVATPSQGFQYTGDVEGPDGPSGLGGASSEGAVSDVAAVEERLDEALAEREGASADCPDAPTGEELRCEIGGGEYSGTITVTPIAGFQWQAQFETPQGSRVVAGNETG